MLAVDGSRGVIGTAPCDKVSLTRQRFTALGPLDGVGVTWRTGDDVFDREWKRFARATRLGDRGRRGGHPS